MSVWPVKANFKKTSSSFYVCMEVYIFCLLAAWATYTDILCPDQVQHQRDGSPLTLRLWWEDSGGYTMKWRRVKPNPCEFFWRKIFRGPCHDMPSTSPDDSGRRLFSLDDTMPSVRPLAYQEKMRKMSRSTALNLPFPWRHEHWPNFTMWVLKYISSIILKVLHLTCVCDCGFIHC